MFAQAVAEEEVDDFAEAFGKGSGASSSGEGKDPCKGKDKSKGKGGGKHGKGKDKGKGKAAVPAASSSNAGAVTSQALAKVSNDGAAYVNEEPAMVSPQLLRWSVAKPTPF